MCEQIQNRFRESEPHKFEETKWQLNQACIAYFHLDQQWYRAKIISLEAHRVKVKSYLRMFLTCSSVYLSLSISPISPVGIKILRRINN